MKAKYAVACLASTCIVLLASSPPASAADVAPRAAATEWASYGRSYRQDHDSPLARINESNITRLGLAWWFDIPGRQINTSVPLEVAGKLYFVTGYSVVRAVDAANGHLLWTYDPQAASAEGVTLRYTYNVRGVAFENHKIFVGTQDGRLIALDAATGRPVWSVRTTEDNDSRYITGAPLAFGNTIVVGNSVSEVGNRRGYVTAYDSETGKQRWRFFTVPGDPRKGFENDAMSMAAKTWSGQWWRDGGGGFVWNALTYDPQTNRIYLGTSNGTPWNQKFRSPGGGDNLFLCSIIALDATTGAYIWHYQSNPGDTWDYDATEDLELAELEVAGKVHRVLMQASKNGFFYVIDRDSGQLLSAAKFSAVTWADRIDLATGRPVESTNARYQSGKMLVRPGFQGAHGPQPMAFNTGTRLVYIPVLDAAATYNDIGFDRASLKSYSFVPQIGINIVDADAEVSSDQGGSWLLAWDPVKQQAAWRVAVPGNGGAGIATTAGNLVFQGRCDGRFVAYSAADGRPLWSFDTRIGIVGAPITYEIGTRQYVSVMAGLGGFTGCGPPGSPWDKTSQPRRLLTFALGEQARLPAAPAAREITAVRDPDFKPDEKAEKDGKLWFLTLCSGCHGLSAAGGGSAPDLRASAAITSPKAFNDIVQHRGLIQQGMPSFDELASGEVESIRQFLRKQAQDLSQTQHRPNT